MDKFTEENIRDDGIRELAAKVKVHPGEEWARDFPDKRGASVAIKTFSGQSHSSSVPLAKGERENPATLEDLMEKFRTNSTQVLSQGRSRKLEETILNLENCSVNDITCLL